MANFYTQISKNKRATYVIVVIFTLVLALLGYFLDLFYGGGLFFTGLALLIAGLGGFISYYNSHNIILAVSKAKEVDDKQGRELHNLVENLSIASGLPKPKIYIIEDAAMNAFATGRNPEHGVICFTSGLLNRLEKRELEGVIAHEMGHIGNYDILLMSVVTVLVGSVALLSDFFTRGLFYSRGRRSRDSGSHPLFLVLGLIFVLLSPLAAKLIKLALGRRREFLADATAVSITRHPKGLADALRKLGADTERLKSAHGATAHLFITNPLKARGGRLGFMGRLFSTHPPVEERISRLESL